MKILQIIILFAAIFFTFSCEKTIHNLDIEEPDPKIVMNGILSNDTTRFLHVSASKYALDADTITIPPAHIELHKEDQLIATYEYDSSGYYSYSGLSLEPGHYVLKATADNYPAVLANIMLPKPTNFTLIDTTTSLRYDANCTGCAPTVHTQVTIEFDDDGQQDDYYILTCKQLATIYSYGFIEVYDEFYDVYYDAQTVTDSSEILAYLNMSSSEVIIDLTQYYRSYEIVSQEYEPYGQAFFFNDRSFNGQSFQFTFSLENLQYELNKNKPSVFIELTKVNKAYFEYAKSMAAYEETNYNPLAEKVTIYSNVENGMGLVIGQSTSQMELDFSYLVE